MNVLFFFLSFFLSSFVWKSIRTQTIGCWNLVDPFSLLLPKSRGWLCVLFTMHRAGCAHTACWWYCRWLRAKMQNRWVLLPTILRCPAASGYSIYLNTAFLFLLSHSHLSLTLSLFLSLSFGALKLFRQFRNRFLNWNEVEKGKYNAKKVRARVQTILFLI